MFELVKSKVNLLEALEKELNREFKECGENTFSLVENDCPYCGHNDCFKIKHDPEDLKSSFYHCFSCEEHGSVIDFISKKYELSLRDAAIKLAKDYSITLPKDHNPIQEIFTLAAKYYHNALVDSKGQMKLSKMSPMEYQIQVRRHHKEVVEHFQIGWGDGGFIEFMESLGFDSEILIESGLKSKKSGGDFLAKDCFIYPHYVNGRVSHFTIKDPLKKIAYQLPSKCSLNGYEFYGQESVKGKDTIIVVEGENDLISTASSTDKYGVIATIGQISTSQLDWLRQSLNGKNIVTIFDADEAGDKYRIKVQKISSSFNSLVQIKPPDGKDIDDFLTSGGDLEGLIASNKVEVKYTPPAELSRPDQGNTTEQGSEPSEPANEGSFFEKFGCYHKVKYSNGEPVYTKLSNFTLKLKNVYLTEEGDRLREIIVIREDGYVSDPIEINSEVKTSLRSFRTFLARAADADFTGSEMDLIAMWRHVYSKAKEILVRVSRTAGRHDRSGGWIFSNKYISDKGVVIDHDDSNIFWLKDNTVGVCVESLNKSSNSNANGDIPFLEDSLTHSEREELLAGFLHNLAKNMGDIGGAVLLAAWMNACAYSDSIYKLNRGFPLLFMWSVHGKGKGTLGAWLMDIYNLAVTGKTTVAQLKSGVGFGRKAEYYASLPLWVDEIRADKVTKEYENTFRTYYDREARSMGSKDVFGVRTQPIRSCFMFSGEDHFEDPATKERCVTVRLPALGRETVESFKWMEERRDKLSAIGYHWILESVNTDHKALMSEIRDLDTKLVVEAKCSSRKSKSWAAVGLFALRLSAKYFPDFDMKTYLFNLSRVDSDEQKGDGTLSQFFERIESIMSQEGFPKITSSHIITEGNELHIWFPHVYRVVNESYGNSFSFTKNAIISTLKEEPYFVSSSKKISMGLNGIRRVVVTLDLTKAPDSVKNIAQTNS